MDLWEIVSHLLKTYHNQQVWYYAFSCSNPCPNRMQCIVPDRIALISASAALTLVILPYPSFAAVILFPNSSKRAKNLGHT